MAPPLAEVRNAAVAAVAAVAGATPVPLRALPPPAPTLSTERLALLAGADLCVKCGLCLPHCPTYGLSRHEADGPRGRIALAQGLATGALAAGDAGVQQHLDGCLSCRACEQVCPAKVPYGQVFDAAQVLLARETPRRTVLPRLFATVLVPRLPRAALRLLLWLASRLSWLRAAAAPRLLRGLPKRIRLRAPHVQGAGVHDGGRAGESFPVTTTAVAAMADPPAAAAAAGGLPEPVALFTGCVGDLLQREALADAAGVLRALGHAVTVPSAQTCCGALHQHAGAAKSAAALAARNDRAFAGARRVLALTPGCAAALRDLNPGLPVEDLCAYLARRLDVVSLAWSSPLLSPTAVAVADTEVGTVEPTPSSEPAASAKQSPASSPALAARIPALPQRIAVHVACTQANVLGAGGAVAALLAHLPGVELLPLAPQAGCCGAAGLQFLRQPEQAERLLAPKLDAAAAMRPDAIASANIGCSLHLAAGLRARGLDVPVVHPVSLLARALA